MSERTIESALHQLAMARRNPRVQWWWGRRGGGSRREYICYVCDCRIDTESANYRMTKHAEAAIEEHAKCHHDVGEELIASGLVPLAPKQIKTLAKYGIDTAALGCREIEDVLCAPSTVVAILEAGLGRRTKETLQRAVADPDYYKALQAADDINAVERVVVQQAA
jgi:hypothetical protein